MKLFYKISFTLMFSLLLSLSIFYFLLSNTVSKETFNGVEQVIEGNFIKVVNLVKKEKLYENPKNMIKKIKMLEENQNFLQNIFVLDNKNIIIFSSNISLINKKFLDIYKNIKFVKNKFNDNKYFYIDKKLTDNKKIIGIYNVDLAIHVIENLDSVFLKYIIIFIIFFFLLIFFLINILLIKPIKYLDFLTQKVSKGDFDIEINFKQKDELGNLAKQFNNMTKSLNQLITEKNTLLRVLSHDLTNQIGSSSSLLKTTIEALNDLEKDDLLEYLSYIVNDLDNAQKLIDFTKKFIAIDAGKLVLNLRKGDLLTIINDSISTFKKKAKDKGINIVLNLIGEEYFSNIDTTVFRYSIIDNLLSNAIKFSISNNDVFIKLSKKGGDIEIMFLNIGEYIPKEKINKLFSLSQKTTSLGTKGETGTGFGLPIVYRFIKLMNASIEIESQKIDEFTSKNIFTIKLKEL